MNSKITVSIFLAMLFGITVLNALAPDRVMSESENRYLQQKPQYSWEALLSGRFTRQFETYITDQFTLRDEWVEAKNLTEYSLARKSSKGVYFGQDGYLLESFDSIDSGVYHRNLGYVERFSARVTEELGIPVRTMLLPTAGAVLRDKLPAHAPELDQGALLAEAEAALPQFVNTLEALRAHSGEYLYYRTDHHWTSLGAYYAYRSWCEATGREAHSAGDFTVEVLSDAFYGTTWSKAHLPSSPADTMEAWELEGSVRVDYQDGKPAADSLYERSYLEVKDKYSAYLNANQPLVHIQTGVESAGSLLILKDSYANTFVQMLTQDFSDIYVMDLRYYRSSAFDFIREHGISEALLLYSLKGFAADPNLLFLEKPLG